MLVLSRRVDEELHFPNLDMRIKVLRTLGNRVQLGIEAPKFIEIVRGERAEAPAIEPTSGISRHELRNELNAVRLALALYDKQMDIGDVDAANQTFLRLVGQLRRADLRLAPASAVPPATTSGGPKVLVVDDDENERQLLAGLLKMDGCEVETAQDGLDAINVLNSAVMPDVVLLDMQMPRLDGKATLAAIRNHDRWRRLLVFGVSGSSSTDYGISVGENQGVDEWFEKPLNPSLLVSRMKQRLQVVATVSA